MAATRRGEPGVQILGAVSGTLLNAGTVTVGGVAGDRVGVVVLDTRITPELKEEGLAREMVNRLQ